MYDCIVVGGGMAGLTSAAYIAREGKKVLLLEKEAYVGGLMNSFKYDGFTIDGGIRSIENSGTVFPMLKELGIKIPFKRSIVTIGIGEDLVTVDNINALDQYGEVLKKHFPDNKQEVDNIIIDIKEIMGLMDIMYGLDNPVFMDMKDPKYIFNTILPWSAKFLVTVPKLKQYDVPVNEYLTRFTSNQQLIDVITQHFFKDTPASFALSYFTLYMDYYYPEGGTRVVPQAMKKYIISKGGEIRTHTEVTELRPKSREVVTKSSEVLKYRKMIWAADQKLLYSLAKHPYRHKLRFLNSGDSVFSVYATFDIAPEDIPATEHTFYTPNNIGVGRIEDAIPTLETKAEIKEWIKGYLKNNTFEISIPAKRYAKLAPKGKSAIIISTLFSYSLTEKIHDMGWYDEFKQFVSDEIIDILNDSIYPFKDKLMNKHSSTPLTIKKNTYNTGGAVTGWSFDNEFMPSVTGITQGSKAVNTKIDHIFQAGAWTFSPSGVPISILTGKLAANAVLKKLRFPFFIKN